MSLTYDTVLGANWDLIWSQNLIAPEPPAPEEALWRYYPIEDYLIPVTFSSTLVAIHASSVSAKPYWRYAGRMHQKIDIGVSEEGTNTAVLSVKRFFLDQFTLLRYLDHYSSQYTLTLNIPYWLRDLDFSIYEYNTSPVDSHETLLNEIKTLVSS